MDDRQTTGIQARNVMTTKLVTLTEDMDVFQAIGLMIKHKISGAPVIDQNRKLLGVFSEKSVMHILIDAAYEKLPTTHVHAFMDRSPHTITEETHLLTIAQIFLNTARRRLPVLNDKQELVGQVSRRDVVRAAYQINKAQGSPEKTLLYLSALKPMHQAPAV